jgi:GNAT superfamily N-acetyltransferase
MSLRSFQSGDREACLEVFDSNREPAWPPSLRSEFAACLDYFPESVLVFEHERKAAGCAAFQRGSDGHGFIPWLLVRRDLRGNGLGRFLLFAALKKLSAEHDPELVEARCPAAAVGFFERQGFRVARVIPDGWGPGLDRVQLTRKLKVCP